MNKIISFVRLDFLTVKPYFTIKNFVILCAVLVFVRYGTDTWGMVIGMTMMYGTIYISYPFVICERNNMDTLYISLSITRKQVVAGRYLFALLLNIFLGVLAIVMPAVLMSIFSKEYAILDLMSAALICFVFFTTIQAFQLPLYFKYGYEKAKFLAYIPLISFSVAVMMIISFTNKEDWLPRLQNLWIWAQGNPVIPVCMIALLWAVFMVISGMLSSRFYAGREF